MRIVSKSGLMALMAVAPMALASDAISAQERQQEQERQQMSQCTARVSTSGQTAGVMGDPTVQQQQERPTQAQSQGIQAGQKATQVTLQLTSPIGNIRDFKAERRDAQTGDPVPQEQLEGPTDLKLAEGDDLPQTQREMARTGEQENEAIQMSSQNSVTLWLNTEEATAGHYHFTLEGENGQCTGQLEVKGGAR